MQIPLVDVVVAVLLAVLSTLALVGYIASASLEERAGIALFGYLCIISKFAVDCALSRAQERDREKGKF